MNVQQLFRVHVHSEIPTSQYAEKPCAHDRAVTPQGTLTQTRDLVSSVLYHSDRLLNDDFTASRRRRDVPSSSPSPLPVTSSGLPFVLWLRCQNRRNVRTIVELPRPKFSAARRSTLILAHLHSDASSGLDKILQQNFGSRYKKKISICEF